MVIDKKINLNLVGKDGNAFALLGAFARQAEKEGWTRDEINLLFKEATNDDYEHLLATLFEHTLNG